MFKSVRNSSTVAERGSEKDARFPLVQRKIYFQPAEILTIREFVRNYVRNTLARMPNIDYKRSFAFATFTVLFRGKLIPNGISSISSNVRQPVGARSQIYDVWNLKFVHGTISFVSELQLDQKLRFFQNYLKNIA